jgi:hypothetical protein
MAEDLMRYDQLAQDALRGVVREALRKVQRSGLPGEHHFYIAFNTRFPGVAQHQFWNLVVTEDLFEVELSFDNIPEKLVVPFAAVKGFLDPSVQFGLQFEVVSAGGQKAEAGAAQDLADGGAAGAAEPGAQAPTDAGAAAEAEEAKVVSLDAFRKK